MSTMYAIGATRAMSAVRATRAINVKRLRCVS